MLKTRLIPVLLIKEGRCVKGVNFGDYRDTGLPSSQARIYNAQRVDELVILDIDAGREGRTFLPKVIRQAAEECFMPLAVGGGIKTVDDISELLYSGADKVVINSGAVQNPEFVKEASEKFGKANIVISVDYRQIGDKSARVAINGGTEITDLRPIDWAIEVEKLGAGEIIFTSIDREGCYVGYDLELIKFAADSLGIPVIAQGGVGNLEHLKEGVLRAKASGVAASSIFHFTDQSPIKARQYLRNEGINLRH